MALAGCGAASTGRSLPGTATPGPSGTATGPSSTASAQNPSAAATESNPPGDILTTRAFVPYTPATGGFTVKVPEGWGRTGTGSTVVFTDKLNSVRIEESTSTAAPTVGSVTSTDVPKLMASVPRFLLKATTTFTRVGGSGVLVTYLADSAADPVTNKVVRDAVERYSFWKGGRLVVVSLTGPQGADNVDPWRKVTDSFGWTR